MIESRCFGNPFVRKRPLHECYLATAEDRNINIIALHNGADFWREAQIG